MRRWTKALLATSAIAMVLGSWTVTRVGADDEVEAPQPWALPAAAFWTGGEAARSARLEGVEVAAQAVEGGYELTFVNPSAADRELRWQVDCSALGGSPLSRMGPIAVRMHEEVLAVRVPANGRATHVIRVAQPAAPEEPVIGFGRFASMRIQITPIGTDAAQPSFALLTVPTEPSAEPSDA